MANSPEDHWLVRHKWWLLGVFGAVGTVVTQFHYIEPNLKRMAELAGLRPAAPMPVMEPAVKKVELAKPTVACLKASAEMIVQLKALPGEKWEPAFNRHFKYRSTCMVLALTDVADGRLTFLFEGDGRWNYLVTPKSRADLKRFKPGMRLLIEGDLDRYIDTGPGVPDEIHIVRARLTEAQEQDGPVTGSIRK